MCLPANFEINPLTDEELNEFLDQWEQEWEEIERQEREDILRDEEEQARGARLEPKWLGLDPDWFWKYDYEE